MNVTPLCISVILDAIVPIVELSQLLQIKGCRIIPNFG